MPESHGLFDSLKRLASTLLAIVQTRFELLSNDIEEARLRVSQMLVYACVALFCLGLSVMLLTVFIVVLFWDTYRLQVLAGTSAFFFAAGVLMLNALRRLALEKPRLFAATLAELSRDRDRLASPHD